MLILYYTGESAEMVKNDKCEFGGQVLFNGAWGSVVVKALRY